MGGVGGGQMGWAGRRDQKGWGIWGRVRGLPRPGGETDPKLGQGWNLGVGGEGGETPKMTPKSKGKLTPNGTEPTQNSENGPPQKIRKEKRDPKKGRNRPKKRE